MQKCCGRVNGLLKTTRQFAEFLEYGIPRKDQKPAIANPQRDVDAAVLRDVERMKYREIEQSLEVEISENARRVDDYSTVSKMVKRGRDILERAFGQHLPASGRCVRAPRTRRRVPRGLRAGVGQAEKFGHDGMADALRLALSELGHGA